MKIVKACVYSQPSVYELNTRKVLDTVLGIVGGTKISPNPWGSGMLTVQWKGPRVESWQHT